VAEDGIAASSRNGPDNVESWAARKTVIFSAAWADQSTSFEYPRVAQPAVIVLDNGYCFVLVIVALCCGRVQVSLRAPMVGVAVLAVALSSVTTWRYLREARRASSGGGLKNRRQPYMARLVDRLKLVDLEIVAWL